MLKKVKIGPVIYKIKKVKEAPDGDDTVPFVGAACILDESIIYHEDFIKGISEEYFLIHEIIEILNWQYELNLNHSKVCTLGTSLTAVLKENPKLLRLFLGGNNG